MVHRDSKDHKRDRVRKRGDKKMGSNSFLRSPKKEEQEVPDTIDTEFVDIKEPYADNGDDTDILDELEGIWGSGNEEKLTKDSTHVCGGQLSWDFMEWEGFGNGEQEEEDEEEERDVQHIDHEYIVTTTTRNFLAEENGHHHEYDKVVKKENLGFWDGDDGSGADEKRVSLNLNLNYQEVLDAWSDRGPLWADDYSLSTASSNGYYMGEVPVMELEERTRREASVLRYKEKRQSRLFSKKIRYQVRKLNADKRPRLKGRFVKRVC